MAIATTYYGTTIGRGANLDDPKADAEAELKKQRGVADGERLTIVFDKLGEALNSVPVSVNSFSDAVRPVLARTPSGDPILSFDGFKLQMAFTDAGAAKTNLTAAIGRVKACRFEKWFVSRPSEGIRRGFERPPKQLKRVTQAPISRSSRRLPHCVEAPLSKLFQRQATESCTCTSRAELINTGIGGPASKICLLGIQHSIGEH